MSKKPHAGAAGAVTSAKASGPAAPGAASAPCTDCKCEDHCLKATRSLHKTALAIARTRAWESVLTANLRPILVALVLVVAIACGVQMPLEWALAGILGGALTSKA
jgi:hypothetical protein